MKKIINYFSNLFSKKNSTQIPVARQHHYVFAHEAVRDLFFKTKKTFAINLLSDSKLDYIKNMWNFVGSTCEKKNFISSSGLEIEVLNLTNEKKIVILTLPKPITPPEAFFVAFLFEFENVKFDNICSKRLLTLEKSYFNHSVVCEWNSEGTHINHGVHFDPQKVNFINYILSIMHENDKHDASEEEIIVDYISFNEKEMNIAKNELSEKYQANENISEIPNSENFLDTTNIDSDFAKSTNEYNNTKVEENKEITINEGEGKEKPYVNENDAYKEKLKTLSVTLKQSDNHLVLKNDWEQFEKILKKNNITELYHITDSSNIDSIVCLSHLVSWDFAHRNGILINSPGGNELSRSLDLKKGLQNYVRLCFHPKLPMIYRAVNDGRMKDPWIIKIKPDVIYWKSTKFSCFNANNKDAMISSSIYEFNKIRFDLLPRNHLYLSEEEKKFLQPEVLVLEKLLLDNSTLTDLSIFKWSK